MCEFNQFYNVPSKTAKMCFFPFTLKEREKEWFFTLDLEFDSWTDTEDAFLRKYYSVGKTSAILTDRFRASLKHKNVGQTKFINPNSQR